jgi:guanosine-3',5'-bis(diphosphate) 3'-pyrophosphohydrolase
LEEVIKTYLPEDKISNVHEAYLLAEKAHQGQKRYSGEDYITHPVAVATILAHMHMDYQCICAALLHDVIEDTPIEKGLIAKKFGPTIADLVDGVSKLTQMSFGNRLEAQAENFRKMLLAMARDIRVIIIKLADRLHNMRTLGVCPQAKRRRIARETLDIFAPIANRLGMHNFYMEFEDLGFAALYPLRYRVLRAAVRRARGNRREIMAEIEQALRSRIDEQRIAFEDILWREKHLYSIYRKMRNKRIPFAEIMDVYAFRVIVDDVDTCYRVLGIVHNLYKPLPERFKDYIAIPKVNSYQSLHTTLFGPYGVPIEVQIRTQDMERIAENGIAAHWLYKSVHQTPDQTQLRARQWLKGLMEIQASTKSPVEFMENVKNDLIPDEVYVFTPKGEIMELPRKATAVDFAYSVHTDIGNSCIAAKINRRLAPLSSILTNGQTVEIITAPGARPNPAWLSFVVTGKARSKIRHYIKGQRRSDSIELGRQLLQKALLSLQYNLDDIAEEALRQIWKTFGYKSLKGLYEAIGLGNHLPIVIAQHLVFKGTGALMEQELINHEAEPLTIKGSQGMVVSFAACCRPIPGDPIVGLFNPGEGLVVHTVQCHNIISRSNNPERYIEVQWEEAVKGDFKVDLEIEVINERGVLAKIAGVIASAGANIDDIKLENHESQFNVIRLTISVQDRTHLARIMRRLREMRMVTRLMRYK